MIASKMHKIKQNSGTAILLAVFLIGLFGTALPASADLMVTPKRIVMEKGNKRATLHLLNTSDETRTYEVSWSQMRMDITGKLVADPDPVAAGNASSFVTASPKRVVLAPGERQAVRLRARFPAELPHGEYMSHLTFAPVGAINQGAAEDAPGAQIKIDVVLGIALPVVVRYGDLAASATLRVTGMDIKERLVAVELVRQGNASIIGNLEGYWGQPGRTGTLVAQLNGVAIYPNINLTTRNIPMNPPEGFQFIPGMLHVIYRDPSTREILAQSTVRVE